MFTQVRSISDESYAPTSVTGWNSLYKIGAAAALIFVLYSLATIIIAFFLGGMPESAQEAFTLLEGNRIVGLLRLDALTLLVVPFYYPIFLSIYAALKETERAFTSLGALLAFAGATLFLATPSAFPLIPLSERYAAAATVAQKQQMLAAGEAILASDMWHGTGAMTGGILMLMAAVILSVVMLYSDRFGKGTAYVGVLTHGLDLVRSLAAFFSPQVGVILMVIAGPLYLVWFPLLARDLLKLGRPKQRMNSPAPALRA
jgi:hypothetical protein